MHYTPTCTHNQHQPTLESVLQNHGTEEGGDLGGRGHTGGGVYLDEPWQVVVVEHEVGSVQLERVLLSNVTGVWMRRTVYCVKDNTTNYDNYDNCENNIINGLWPQNSTGLVPL